MGTFTLVVIGIILLALVDFLNKLASITGINPVFGSLVFGLAALLVPSVWIAVYEVKHVQFASPIKSLLFAGCAGLLIGLMDIVWYKIFQNQGISWSVPLMRTGAIVAVFVSGVFLLKEKVDLLGIIGFVLTVSGAVILLSRAQ